MENITIRKSSLGDSYNILRLIIPQFAQKSDQELEQGDYTQKWLKNFKEMQNSPLVNSFIATNTKSELIGVITVYLLPRLELAGMYAVIEDVYVKESERNNGVGSVLLKHVIKFLEGMEVKYVTLNVDKKSEKAQNFYRKHGFETEALEMRLEITKH